MEHKSSYRTIRVINKVDHRCKKEIGFLSINNDTIQKNLWQWKSNQNFNTWNSVKSFYFIFKSSFKPGLQVCVEIWTLLRLKGVKEKSSSGKKFESPKKSNFFPLKLFSSKIFLVHMEADVLQQWQTTHFKACSKWWRMKW